MKTITLNAVITGTSNKQSDKFEVKNPRKSIYLSVDKENEKKLIDFGLTKYTSKEDGADFFIVKSSDVIKRYENGVIVEKISGSAKEGSVNFSSNEHTIEIALMESEKSGNKFVRMYAINCGEDVVTENEPQNPFA